MSPDPPHPDITAMLKAVASGDSVAAEQLFVVVYGELHRIATACMQQERPEHTLQATALVHEAYLRLVGDESSDRDYQSHRQFVAAAAVAMRRILINHARARSTEKRGGERTRVALDEAAAAFDDRSIDLLALDEALEQLATLDPVQARIVELRFFGGMTVRECAELLNVSERTVQYEWAHARAWLRGQLERT